MSASTRVAAVHVDRHLEQVEAVEVEVGQVQVFSTPCPTKPSRQNEDGAAVIGIDATTAVLAVADGLGGHPAGDQASKLALSALERTVLGGGAGPDTSDEAILAAFELANREVSELGVGAGTTMVVLVVKDEMVRSFHVGDSGALVLGGRGRIKLQTPWHSPVGYALRAGLIDEDEAMIHADRHLISNVVGDAAMQIEIGPRVQLAPRDTILLATDGLFDNLTTTEIVAGLVGGRLPERTRALIAECRERMARAAVGRPSKPDDLTMVAVRPGERFGAGTPRQPKA